MPVRLLLIDSASTDSTVERIEAWLNAHPEAFLEVDLLRMETRQGKTPAVIRALKHLGQHAEGLVCMTDADALLERGCLRHDAVVLRPDGGGGWGRAQTREGHATTRPCTERRGKP